MRNSKKKDNNVIKENAIENIVFKMLTILVSVC